MEAFFESMRTYVLSENFFRGALITLALTILSQTIGIVLNIGEGIDQGFDFWDLLVIGISEVFIVQAVSRLRSSPEVR